MIMKLKSAITSAVGSPRPSIMTNSEYLILLLIILIYLFLLYLNVQKCVRLAGPHLEPLDHLADAVVADVRGADGGPDAARQLDTEGEPSSNAGRDCCCTQSQLESESNNLTARQNKCPVAASLLITEATH